MASMQQHRSSLTRSEPSVSDSSVLGFTTSKPADRAVWGNSANDLPVAKFCSQIEAEWLEILGIAGSQGNEWMPESVKVQ
jgi:hypothetical protein